MDIIPGKVPNRARGIIVNNLNNHYVIEKHRTNLIISITQKITWHNKNVMANRLKKDTNPDISMDPKILIKDIHLNFELMLQELQVK